MQAVTAETVSYDFMTQLENGVNDMGVTDRILSLSPYATNACAQKALACKNNRRESAVSAPAARAPTAFSHLTIHQLPHNTRQWWPA